MKLDHLIVHGLSSAFPGVVDLPLRDLEAGLIALTGGNGNGKTTLLEAGPGSLYRQLPSRDGADPVEYAIGRDSYIDFGFTVEGQAFRALLNLDGPKRQSDAVLEAVAPDGTRTALNDGKRSTYDAVIAAKFPSFDLFINSAFAAQGRGDEFTRRKPSQRKDLFTEFLGLRHLLAMAKTASDAADLAGDARLRLTVQLEALQRDTLPEMADVLDAFANDLQAKGGQAELRRRELQTVIADLEARTAVAGDQAAAYAAVTHRVATVATNLADRRAELQASRMARTKALEDGIDEIVLLDRRRDAILQDCRNRILSNQMLLNEDANIRAAVLATHTIDGQLVEARERQQGLQTRRNEGATALSQAEAKVHSFTSPTQQLERAKTDAALLEHVPCHGAGAYAACELLVNAKKADARIAELETTVAGLTAALARVSERQADLADIDTRLTAQRTLITRLEADRKGHEAKAKYDTPLAEAKARLAELEQKQRDAEADHAQQSAAAAGRHTARQTEFDVQDGRLEDVIAELEISERTARWDLDAATSRNSQAVELQFELTLARREWDTVTGTLASVKSGHEDLARRRELLASKRARLADVGRRLVQIEQELVEWQDLAKALGKGGLPDLEIDAAGPTISVLCNQFLLACYGPRFSIELVTQVERADGSGQRDLFTVRVFDNEQYGGWRDISQLSGGQKVIVQEALMSAISIYVNERSPMPIRTLFRDETGAALDPENAVAYVAMLRKVRELGGFHHVFFVSHNAAASALADAQIQVGDGAARIVHAPFTEAA